MSPAREGSFTASNYAVPKPFTMRESGGAKRGAGGRLDNDGATQAGRGPVPNGGRGDGRAEGRDSGEDFLFLGTRPAAFPATPSLSSNMA